jgi:hypothetical protein
MAQGSEGVANDHFGEVPQGPTPWWFAVRSFMMTSLDFNLTRRGRLTLQGQLRISSAVFTFHAAKAADLRN